MLDINIDLTDKINEFAFSDEEAKSLSNYVLDRIVDEYMSKWENLIRTSLKTSSDEYKRAMYTDRPDDNTAIIGLSVRDSKLAIMLEEGASSFDIKEGFSNSKKKTIKDNGGWYLTIPFRHGSSDSIMDMMSPQAGVSLKDLMMSGQTVTPKDLPAGFDKPQTHSIKLNTGKMITYQHKSPIYEGMKRYEINSTDKEKRGGYMTFRRVSDNSYPESWMHPGFIAMKLMEKALADTQLPEVVGAATQDFLDMKFGK